jgi:hypothetical protein
MFCSMAAVGFGPEDGIVRVLLPIGTLFYKFEAAPCIVSRRPRVIVSFHESQNIFSKTFVDLNLYRLRLLWAHEKLVHAAKNLELFAVHIDLHMMRRRKTAGGNQTIYR